MHSFINLLTRLNTLTEAESPMDRIMPGFQTKARSLAVARGASSPTREGRIAMIKILYNVDIIDHDQMIMLNRINSVEKLVQYFEESGIASLIKDKRDDIEEYIKNQLEDKISFATGQRSDVAQQRYEVNMINNEIKAAKKVARLERKKETASAMSHVSQVVDEILDSYEQSFSEDYMMEIIVGKDSDLNDISNILKYLSKYVDEEDVEVDGRYIDAVFKPSSKLGRIIDKVGVKDVQKEITKDLKTYNDVVEVKISLPDINQKEKIMGNLKKATAIEDEEGYGRPEEDAETKRHNFSSLAQEYSDGTVDPEVRDAQRIALKGLSEGALMEGTAVYLTEGKLTNLAAATVLGAAALGVPKKIAQNFKEPINAVSKAVGDITAGGNAAFLKRVKSPEDKESVTAAIERIRSAGTDAAMSRKTDQYKEADSNLRQIEDEMRKKYDIPENIHLHENVDSGTGIYLSEQVRRDAVKRSDDQKSITFKEKYKPKTYFQLEELRRYGL